MDDKSKPIDNSNKIHVNRPNIIFMDIYGVITSWDFCKKLQNYCRNNISNYLSTNFKEKRIVDTINKLREQALIDKSAGHDIPLIEQSDKPQNVIIKSVETNFLWQLDRRHNTCKYQLNFLSESIWSEGYTKSQLKTHTFNDVKKALNHWRSHQFIKIYSYSSASSEAQKLFLKSSESGDLSEHMANHMIALAGSKTDPRRFQLVVSALREKSDPKNILYLTDDPEKARAAISAGLRAIVVIRSANTTYTKQQLKGLQTVSSFDDIVFDEVTGKPAPCC